MLKIFEVEGFKNFKDKFTLDFSDIKEYKFNKECVNNQLLNSLIIYGKNSVGKTNFGYALFDITIHVVDKNKNLEVYKNYLNANNDKPYASFKYVFQFGDVEIDYRYKKTNPEELLYEELHINNKKIFDFDFKKQKINLESINELDIQNLSWEFKDSSISILKYIANNTKLKANSPIRLVVDFISKMLWFRSLEFNSYIGYQNGTDKIIKYIANNDLVKDFEEFLRRNDVDVNLRKIKSPSGEKQLYFDYKRPILFIDAASSATKTLALFYYWYKHFSDTKFIFIDDFDAYYHFELSEKIVELLKLNNCQSILTTHNTNLLNNKILRPDCYFLITKKRITSLINVTSRELKEGHNLEKLYINGEFNN